jgi:hypothetical protein
MTDLPLVAPAGYGFRSLPCRNFPEDLYDRLLVWEPRRDDSLYIASVDVGDGIGQDRSVVDVTRVGTLKEPDEQVAQFVSAWTDPMELARICDAIGRFYKGSDGQEALMAVECNNHGLVTQNELQQHLGYDNFFIWQYMDAADPQRAFSTRIGWWTTPRTRPLILARYLKVLKTIDDVTDLPDYRINSPLTIEELRSFQTVGGIRDAEADPTDPDAHDDCIMAGAIGVHVSATLQYEGGEPLADARRRRSDEKARQDAVDGRAEEGRDYQNQEFTAEEVGMEEAFGVYDGGDHGYT